MQCDLQHIFSFFLFYISQSQVRHVWVSGVGMKWGLEGEGESPCLDCGVSVVGKHSSLWSSVVPRDRSNRHGEILLPAFLEACPPSSFAPVYCGYASDLWHKAPPCLISWTWCEIVFLSGRFGQGSKLGIIKGFSLLHMKKERKREILSRNILSRDFKKQTDEKTQQHL